MNRELGLLWDGRGVWRCWGGVVGFRKGRRWWFVTLLMVVLRRGGEGGNEITFTKDAPVFSWFMAPYLTWKMFCCLTCTMYTEETPHSKRQNIRRGCVKMVLHVLPCCNNPDEIIEILILGPPFIPTSPFQVRLPCLVILVCTNAHAHRNRRRKHDNVLLKRYFCTALD